MWSAVHTDPPCVLPPCHVSVRHTHSTFSEIILPTQKIEFESCKYLEKRSDSELLQKNGGILRPKSFFFSKHFGLIHLAGLRVLKHFLKKNIFFLFSFISIFLYFPIHLLSSFSSCLFFSLSFSLPSLSCFASSLFLSSFSFFWTRNGRAPSGVTSEAPQHCCENNCHNIHYHDQAKTTVKKDIW